MEGILLPVCSLFFSGLLCYVYFSKERVDLLENKMYSCMLVCSLLDSLLVTILQTIAFFYTPGTFDLIINLLNKIDFILLIIICNCIFYYIAIITLPMFKNKFRKFSLPFIITNFIIFLFIIFGNVDVIKNENVYTASGSSVIISELLCGLYLLMTLIIILFNLKKVDKRYFFVFVMLLLLIGVLVVVNINPYLIWVSIVVCFVNYIMYFTIENPDIKMIARLNEAKDEAEKANSAKLNFYQVCPSIKVETGTTHEKVEVTNKNVLVVDDNKINLKVAERLLETYGLGVKCVESGFECIDILKKKEKYDLILMDDMMPRMSGVETLHKIKEEIKGFNIPVVALTANALTGMREKYLADGFNDYLAKPINKDELNKVINEYLNKED